MQFEIQHPFRIQPLKAVSDSIHLDLKWLRVIFRGLDVARKVQSLVGAGNRKRPYQWLSIHLFLFLCYANSLQSCPTLCNPIDGSPPGSSVPGILQARTLEWVAISFSKACMLSRFRCVRLYAALWTAAHQAPLSTGFSRQEYWSGLPFPSPLVSRG